MSVNEEFLDKLLDKLVPMETYISEDGQTFTPVRWDREGEIEEAKQAILQHFQQEQERAVLIARVDELGKLPASPQVYKREAGFRLRALEKELSKHKEQCWCGSKENPHIHSGECPSNTTGL